MDKDFKGFLTIAIAVFLILTAWFIYEYSKTKEPQRTFFVTGEGKETVIPNVAEIKIGLITKGKDLNSIQKENSEKMNKVIDYLKKQGIKDDDIKTENYSINPEYNYKTTPPSIVGYVIEQNLSVKIRDLSKIGEILNNVVKNGANQVSGPTFTLDDPEIYLEKAREKAIIDAKQKAEKIAKTAGFKLGKIISISENPQPAPISFYSMSTKVQPTFAPEIQPGSQEVKVQVTITYEIK